MGFEAGWGAAADQLKALCEAGEPTGTPATSAARDLRPAPRRVLLRLREQRQQTALRQRGCLGGRSLGRSDVRGRADID